MLVPKIDTDTAQFISSQVMRGFILFLAVEFGWTRSPTQAQEKQDQAGSRRCDLALHGCTRNWTGLCVVGWRGKEEHKVLFIQLWVQCSTGPVSENGCAAYLLVVDTISKFFFWGTISKLSIRAKCINVLVDGALIATLHLGFAYPEPRCSQVRGKCIKCFWAFCCLSL